MNDKVALITGSARGLGRIFAEALLRNGAKVCISDINVEHGRETEKAFQEKYSSDRVFFVKCDVTADEEFENAIKQVIERFGGLDILCNNAGIGNEIDWRSTLAVNLSAVIHGTLLGLRYMGKAVGRRGGVIINISSAAGLVPMPVGPVYSASKHGVVGFTSSIGYLSPKLNDVQVNSFCPSFVETDLVKNGQIPIHSVYNGDPAFVKPAKALINNVGLIPPEEVAASFLELVQDEKASGAVMLVTPHKRKLLKMPTTLPQLYDKISNL